VPPRVDQLVIANQEVNRQVPAVAIRHLLTHSNLSSPVVQEVRPAIREQVDETIKALLQTREALALLRWRFSWQLDIA
jgi:hypothetical protein